MAAFSQCWRWATNCSNKDTEEKDKRVHLHPPLNAAFCHCMMVSVTAHRPPHRLLGGPYQHLATISSYSPTSKLLEHPSVWQCTEYCYNAMNLTRTLRFALRLGTN